MRESVIEKAVKKSYKKSGVDSFKFTSPGRPGVPDRLNLARVPEKHRAIVEKYIWFTELKKPGETPEPHQKRCIAHLRDLGFRVDVIDRKPE